MCQLISWIRSRATSAVRLRGVHRLGGTDWSKAKPAHARRFGEIAGELVRLYAIRQNSPGYSFGPDTPWQAELEDAFPFAETPDQLVTIDEVKADMEKSVPMDRIVWGRWLRQDGDRSSGRV